MAETVSMEEMDVMDCQVPKDLRGLQGNLVPPVDPQGHKGRLELGGQLDHRELWDQLDQGVEGSSTPGGERAHVLTSQEQQWCTQGELEGPITGRWEVELTIYVCL